MIKANELKLGAIARLDGQPHIVEDLQIQTPSARGGASLYKVRFRNLVSRQKADRTFRGDDAVEEADFRKVPVAFSYQNQGSYVFTDLADYSEYVLDGDRIGESVAFLTEGLEGVFVLVSDDRVLGVELPPSVELEITACDPPLRGASATSRSKPATLATGWVVQVPDYMSRGEVVRVDTRTGKFLSRA